MLKHFLIFIFLFTLIGCSDSLQKAEYLYNSAMSTATVYPNSANKDSIRYSLQLLNKAISIDPTDSRFYSLKCNLYLLLEDGENAFNAAKIGWDKTEDSYTLALFTGAMFERKNENEDAKKYYSAALERINHLDTTNINIYLDRALILMLLDNPIETSIIKSKINENQDSLQLNKVFNRIIEANNKDSLVYLITGVN